MVDVILNVCECRMYELKRANSVAMLQQDAHGIMQSPAVGIQSIGADVRTRRALGLTKFKTFQDNNAIRCF